MSELILNTLLMSRVIISLSGLAGSNCGKSGENNFDR
jgi:hypothetical protein